jgi:5-methylcytosine-specific restriction endonuclease McrA
MPDHEHLLGTEPADAPVPDYWHRIAAPEKAGEAAREWEQRVLVEARSQIDALSAEDERDLVAKQKGRCAICGRRLGKKHHHFDLVIPFALGGTAYKSNLQIVHPACNHRKHAKDPFVFARRNG